MRVTCPKPIFYIAIVHIIRSCQRRFAERVTIICQIELSVARSAPLDNSGQDAKVDRANRKPHDEGKSSDTQRDVNNAHQPQFGRIEAQYPISCENHIEDQSDTEAVKANAISNCSGKSRRKRDSNAADHQKSTKISSGHIIPTNRPSNKDSQLLINF